MPTYEYRCRDCGHRFERFQKMTEDPVSECPECGEDAAERIISPGGGLIFKGPGFYATDYRDGPKPGRSGDDAASGSADGESAAGADGGSGSGSGSASGSSTEE